MTEIVQSPEVPGWREFVETLAGLPQRMLEKLPGEMRDDPSIRQEVGRLAIESLGSAGLATLAGDGDNPQFMPVIGQVLNIGQPNADTLYRSAKVFPDGSYRLRGKAGSLNHSVISQVIPGVEDRPHLRLSDVLVDRAGRYDILLSPRRPQGHTGDWWELHPAATGLMIRMVSTDWANEQSPTIAIERIDRPQRRPRAGVAELEQRLRAMPRQIEFQAMMLFEHVEQLRQQGYVNRFKVFDVGAGALAGQFYYECAFELADDEALIVESPVPARCPYRSLILTNDLYETIDWYNNHSSLNNSQAEPDADGMLRIVIGARDPGVRNWLDTAGHPRGAIQGRWTDCDSQPIPEVRKVRFDEIAQYLPPDTRTVTPDERQAILRERRRALLERPHW